MFNNLINIRDITGLVDRVRTRGAEGVAQLFARRQRRVEHAWQHIGAESPPENWWDIPAVRRRWNRLISGDEHTDYRAYIFEKYFAGKGPLKALSLGCGAGQNELAWSALGAFAHLDAYDLSSKRIEYAQQMAAARGLAETLKFQVGDIYEIDFPTAAYDVVLAEGSLHHFSPLEDILQRIHRLLRPGGLFVLNEFVGPTRFQWTDRQLEVINALLAILPPSHRRRLDGSIKAHVFRPSRLGMTIIDPSEAVESANILPLLHKRFEVIELRPFGGTILHMLFNGIAHNFLGEDKETQRLSQLCFDVEDLLLSRNEIQSDFVVAVGRKPDRALQVSPQHPLSAL